MHVRMWMASSVCDVFVQDKMFIHTAKAVCMVVLTTDWLLECVIYSKNSRVVLTKLELL